MPKIQLFFILLIAYSSSFCQQPNSLNATSAQLGQLLKEKKQKIGNEVFIRIFKEEKELELWMKKPEEETFTLFKTYPICTYGPKGLGPKLKEGDKMAPEGFYYVPKSRLNPNSNYHLAFNLGFPNDYDKAHQRTGSALMVHGDCVSIGCYAMTDTGIDEIYRIVEAALNQGQKFFRVHCFPFRMTKENMQKHQKSNWLPFWQNLQEGYLFFEEKQYPPNVEIQHLRYVFN